MYKLICKNCGKEFESKKKETRFCSRSCYQEYCKNTNCLKGINRVERVEVTCANCGKKEYVLPGRAKTYVCCSKNCIAEYNAKRYDQKIEVKCKICGEPFYIKPSQGRKRKTCGKKECLHKGLSVTRIGSNNSNYRRIINNLKETGVSDTDKDLHRHVVKEFFGFNSLDALPKGYHIHHKDADHHNNDPHNLILLPQEAHMLVHRFFGNILISALHTGKISRQLFFELCNKEQKEFYEQIIDIDITNQVVVKQGELLENPEVGNQQPSVYSNIYVGSETNTQVLPDNAGDSNGDTSALPINNSEDIVQTACITTEDAEVQNKESVR